MFRSFRHVKGVVFEDPKTVTDLTYLFLNNESSNLELTYLDTRYVTHMTSMFFQSKATKLNLGFLDTRSLRDIGYMFYLMPNITEIHLGNIDLSKLTRAEYIFGSINSSVRVKYRHAEQKDKIVSLNPDNPGYASYFDLVSWF